MGSDSDTLYVTRPDDCGFKRGHLKIFFFPWAWLPAHLTPFTEQLSSTYGLYRNIYVNAWIL